MLNVCHIISGDLWAGAEVMAYHLLKGLKAYSDLTLSAILLNEGRLAEEIRELGIEIHVVDESNTSFFGVLLAIRKIFKHKPLGVIHSHRYKESILGYLASRYSRGLKLIGTQHSMPKAYGERTSFRHRIISTCNFLTLHRSFHRVVAVSEDIQKALLKQYGFTEDKVTVIHNGIEIPDILPKKDSVDNFVIGSSGRLFPIKDYSLMVKVAKEVSKKTNHISFHLAGDGPERSKLQALIKRHGLNGAFELKGHLDDISAFYQGLDLYLNTSVSEGIPMSVLEAMAQGLPVVAPNVGGLKEIVEDGVQGYLIKERDPRSFAEKILLLYEKRALRKQMSADARDKVVRGFSVEHMAKQYFNLYVSMSNNV